MRAGIHSWLVYLLRCRDGTLYCGITNDLERRLKAHGRGDAKYTRGRLPVEVAHVEPAADKSAALRAEAAWKKLSRREKWLRIDNACLSAGRTVPPKDDAELVPVRRRRGRVGRRV